VLLGFNGGMGRRIVGALLASVVVVIAGCSSSASSKQPPQTAVSDALTATTSSSGKVTFTTFGSTDQAVQSASVILTYDTPSAAKADTKVMLGSTEAADLVVDAGIAYLKADVNAIGSALGSKAATKLKSQLDSAAGQISAIKDLEAGKYVSLDLKAVAQLAKAFGSGSSAPPPDVQQILASVRSALLQNSTTTRVGSDSVGDHYRLVVQAKPFLQAVATELNAAAGPAASFLQTYETQVENGATKPITADLWVSGGKVKQLTIDLRQEDPQAFGIKAVFGDEGGSVTPPSGASPIDLTKLAALASGLGLLGGK
jgi:hypothetical protein